MCRGATLVAVSMYVCAWFGDNLLPLDIRFGARPQPWHTIIKLPPNEMRENKCINNMHARMGEKSLWIFFADTQWCIRADKTVWLGACCTQHEVLPNSKYVSVCVCVHVEWLVHLAFRIYSLSGAHKLTCKCNAWVCYHLFVLVHQEIFIKHTFIVCYMVAM